MKYIKWGFIGCGNVVERRSGEAFAMVEGSEVVAVMSRNAVKARNYAGKHNIKTWTSDANEIIYNPDINAVYVATPPASHATYAIMAMKAGKLVYVEKPLAASYDDCLRINKVSQETGVPCFVAYYKRYLPYYEKVAEIVRSGVLGKINTVQIKLFRPAEGLDKGENGTLPWRFNPELAGGGLFYDLASHQFDFLQYLFGVIIRAYGMPRNNAGLYEAEDTVNACFEFENNLTGVGSWCFANHSSAKEDCIQITGDKGMITYTTYEENIPIKLKTDEGETIFNIASPPMPELSLIKKVVEHLQGFSICNSTSISTTPTNWVMDRILGKI